MSVTIDLDSELTIENVRRLLASGDDSTHTQIRILDNGLAYLSDAVGADDRGNVAFRLETFTAGGDHVGPEAANDQNWVKRIYNALDKNWPNPTSTYIDDF